MWARGPWLATGLLGLALLLGTGSAAGAVQQAPLAVSLDGQQWGSELNAPLFDEDHRWVPGDTETVTVWVRNSSADRADLEVALLDDGGSGSSRLVDLTARVDGQPLAVGHTDSHRVPASDTPTRLELTATMPEAAGNIRQEVRISFRLQVRLTQAVGTSSGPPPAGTPSPGTPSAGTPSVGTPSAGSSSAAPTAPGLSLPVDGRPSGGPTTPGLSQPVAGHLAESGAPPLAVPLTVAAVAFAARAALVGHRRQPEEEDTSCQHH